MIKPVKKKTQVQIFKGADGRYNGKIVWLHDPTENGKPKVDKNNPEEKLRTQPIFGMLLLKGFSFDADKDEWSDGTIYDPLNGKTYKCFMKFSNATTLKVSGYIGKQWMGFPCTLR